MDAMISAAKRAISPYKQGFSDFHAQVYDNTFTGEDSLKYNQGNADARRQFCHSHEVRHHDRSGATIITCHYSQTDAYYKTSWRRYYGHLDAEVVYVGT